MKVYSLMPPNYVYNTNTGRISSNTWFHHGIKLLSYDTMFSFYSAQKALLPYSTTRSREQTPECLNINVWEDVYKYTQVQNTSRGLIYCIKYWYAVLHHKYFMINYNKCNTIFCTKWTSSTAWWWTVWNINTLRPRQDGRHLCGRYFQMHFLEWKCMNCCQDFTEVCS